MLPSPSITSDVYSHLPQRKDLRVLQVLRTSFCISLLGFSDSVAMNAVMQTLGEAVIISGMG